MWRGKLKILLKKEKGFKIQSFNEEKIRRESLGLTNRRNLTIAYLIIFSLIIFISEIISTYFTFDYYIYNQKIYFLITLIILVYGLFSNSNYYNIKINTEEISIRNHKLIIGILNSKNCLNVSKKNLLNYSFTNHSLSFNKTLILKIKYDEGEVLSKSFILSFLSRKEELRIKKYLEKLLKKNKQPE